uniref:Uncharacterized protein n=1 Tax=Plectus sambesii TaxID=2011161 RepID=A0A914UI65_9BILA
MASQHSGATTNNGKIRITYLPTEPTTSSNNVLIQIPSSSSSGSDLRQVIGTKRRATIEGPPTSTFVNGAPMANKRPTYQVGQDQLSAGDANLASRLQTVITKLAASEERREKQDVERRLQMRETLRVEAVRSLEERGAKLLAEKRELEDRLRRAENRLKEDCSPSPSSSSLVSAPSSENDFLRADLVVLKTTVDAVKKHFESKLEQLTATCETTKKAAADLSKRLPL